MIGAINFALPRIKSTGKILVDSFRVPLLILWSFTMTLILLFLTGIAIDLVSTIYVMAIADRKPITATFAAMLITAFGMIANWVVISDKDKMGALAYILGCGIGTLFVVAIAKRREKK